MFESMKAEYFDILLRAKKGYAQSLEPICRQWNLTRNELDILLFLLNNPGFDRAADIVTRRGIAKSHVSLSVSTLEQKGLIRRQTDENDRRTVHLTMTDAAREAAGMGRTAQETFFRKIYAGLTVDELNQWIAIMEKLSRNIRNLD